VNICLSKGLGAPVGSLLCGGQALIAEARRWRKVAGGGMRQAGILAAAGLYALENHVHRLAEDHANARLLAGGLAEIDGLMVDLDQVQTNMVFVTLMQGDPLALQSHLEERGIIVRGGRALRLVTHLDLDREDVGAVIGAFREFFAGSGRSCGVTSPDSSLY